MVLYHSRDNHNGTAKKETFALGAENKREEPALLLNISHRTQKPCL
jgi:hypothetical protein